MKNLVMIFLSLVFISAAHAEEDLILDVPRSNLSLPESERTMDLTPKYFEISASTWQPDQFSQVSQLPMTSSFSKIEGPKISLSYNTPLKTNSLGIFSSHVGISYLQLERTGYINVGTTGIEVSQKTNLYQALVGMAYEPNKTLLSVIKPYAVLSLSPIWVQSARSEFNSGVSEVEWSAQASAGLSFNIKPVAQWIGIEDMAVNIAIDKTQDLQSDSLTGTGVAIGTKVGWY
ncbi:MAG: hypothetical protein AABY64_07875 [Bdellovibrionota bacterium]